MARLLDAARERSAAMVDDLAALVEHESPSADRLLTARCAEHVAGWVTGLLGGHAEPVVVEGATHLRFTFAGTPRLLLLGHLDTVWPAGTLARWPFDVRDGRAGGPGCFDMKAGLVQAVHALSLLPHLDGVTLLVTSDEELGSPTSTRLIEETALGLRAVLVAEPSAGGALKTARKGVGVYDISITGRAAHAGLEPERGRNATIAAAQLVLAASTLGDAALGTTCTPTVLNSGTTSNTVPGAATLAVDVRAGTQAEQRRVDAALRALTPAVPDVTVAVRGGINRAPLEPARSAELFALAREVAGELGLAPPAGVAVGGGSDGNITAGLGVPTLDGLGAVGDGAHAEGEWVDLAAMPERTALLAGLAARLLS